MLIKWYKNNIIRSCIYINIYNKYIKKQLYGRTIKDNMILFNVK